MSENKQVGVQVEPQEIEELIRAALSADYTRLRRVVNRIVHSLREHGESESAQRLRAITRTPNVPMKSSGYMETLPVDAKSRLPLVEEEDWPSTPLFLNESAHSTFDTFLTDIRNSNKLKSKGIASNLRLILSGPPGTGKSLSAGHVAAHLRRPFYIARLDSIISSLLGDTAKNIRSLFDFLPQKKAVLLIDEIDAITKLRDDKYELGELKRVVNAVIQGLDSLDETTVIIAATNHPHLLDPAIWRRFPYKIEMQLPTFQARESMWRHFLFEDCNKDDSVCSFLATLSVELSGSDIEMIALALRRNAALTDSKIDLRAAGLAIIGSSDNRPNLPRREPMTSREKRILVRAMYSRFHFCIAEIARLIRVSRPTVYKYLKEDDHGG